ncbi:MAG TPA: YciI family protein [Bacteroidia bacterium]|jgi:hypothetical protein|nr:YciI family protein [Bacteroidia bacterium]
MKEYVLIFRMDILTEAAQPGEEQASIYMQQWMQWLNDISARGQLASGGNHLSRNGTVLRKNSRVDRPYTENNESVAGYILVLAKNKKDALAIAEKCPILQGDGTSVEIRETDNP